MPRLYYLCILYLYVYLILEPGTAPRNVQVRPLSSSTMVIQWDEPETPNGQVMVRKLLLVKYYRQPITTVN